ncbi:uncharacterized protein STEHIDRAFT_156122 [Stereum hirsutum FP-91666 SS1]|uniref:uncharacterized protein n=1 Tax=Stereum hirsutum (strain FP-91666) TaxID=721885 RepID=UPI000440C222|nr:uncharacterized protein STEHIDRAFT_156122 [Stereum hirsutum FP-91666 SS1]EIM87133.1 hypothetical protein STEHIDRAFT_156122 [Stereum hirsutum FP-91666 SS1]
MSSTYSQTSYASSDSSVSSSVRWKSDGSDLESDDDQAGSCESESESESESFSTPTIWDDIICESDQLAGDNYDLTDSEEGLFNTIRDEAICVDDPPVLFQPAQALFWGTPLLPSYPSKHSYLAGGSAGTEETMAMVLNPRFEALRQSNELERRVGVDAGTAEVNSTGSLTKRDENIPSWLEKASFDIRGAGRQNVPPASNSFSSNLASILPQNTITHAHAHHTQSHTLARADQAHTRGFDSSIPLHPPASLASRTPHAIQPPPDPPTLFVSTPTPSHLVDSSTHATPSLSRHRLPLCDLAAAPSANSWRHPYSVTRNTGDMGVPRQVNVFGWQSPTRRKNATKPEDHCIAPHAGVSESSSTYKTHGWLTSSASRVFAPRTV